MPSTSPNFYRILSDTIDKAGLRDNERGRQDIYRRARATVVDRARANNAPNIDELETHLSAAIERIEAEIAPPPPPPPPPVERVPDPAPEPVMDVADPEPDPADGLQEQPARQSGGLGLGLGSLFNRPKPEPKPDPADGDDPSLDRIAADLAAGFKEIDFEKVTPGDQSLAATAPKAEDKPRRSAFDFGLRPAVEPDPPETPDPDVSEPVDVAVEAPVDELPDDRMASETHAMANPGFVRFAVLALLFAAIGFWIGTIVATARSNAPGPIIAAQPVDLTGAAWRSFNAEVQPSTAVTWNGFEVADRLDNGFAWISLPLASRFKGTAVQVRLRLQKAEQVVSTVPLIRVLFETMEASVVSDVTINPSTGEVATRGGATEESVSIVDEGDTYLITLTVNRPEGRLYRNPVVDIYPAIGTFRAGYSPAMTGSVIIGDFNVQALD